MNGRLSRRQMGALSRGVSRRQAANLSRSRGFGGGSVVGSRRSGTGSGGG